MSYQAALDYIKAGRARNLSDADIAARLRGVGWRSADVQDAFALLASMGRVPEPVARLASTPAVMERPTYEPHVQPEPEPEPTPTPAQPTSAEPAPTPKAKRVHSTSMRWVGWITLVLAAFVIGYVLV